MSVDPSQYWTPQNNPSLDTGMTPTALPTVDVNSYNLDSNQFLSGVGNPFANDSGSAPLTGWQPDMQSIPDTSGDLGNNLQSEISAFNFGSGSSGGGGGGGGGGGNPFGGNLMNTLTGLGLGAYGLSEAKAAQQQTAQEIAPLKAESSSMLGESQQLLKNYNAGNLPDWAKNYVDWTSAEANSILTSGSTTALQKIAASNFTDYQSGALKPADQQALDNQVASQKQQIASQLAASGNVDSSVLSAYYQQIDNQASITRQQVLNSYFQTGDSAYNSWLNANTQATQIKTLGAQFSQQTFQNMMSDALSAANVGDAALTQAIGLEVQSDSQLSSMIGNLMQGIATAFSYGAATRAMGGGVGGGGGGGGGSNFGSQAGSFLNSLLGGNRGYFKGAGGQAAAAALGIYQGLEQGGVAGYGEAGISAGNLAVQGAYASGAMSAGTAAAAESALGYAAAPLALYNFGKNWQSGNTGSDALSGAETGAAIGSVIPGVGTFVGAVLGGAVGAISSAFGGGRTDPETLNWNSVAPQLNANPQAASTLTGPQAYQLLAGMMDAKNNSPGHSTNLELKFGRMGEGSVVDAMTGWVNSAIKQNPQLAQASPQQLYQQVVKPQLQSMGAYVNPTDIISSNGTKAGGAVDAVLTQLLALWQSGQLNSSSQVGVSGQTISGLPGYA